MTVLVYFFVSTLLALNMVNSSSIEQFKQHVTTCRGLHPVTDEILQNLQRSGTLLDTSDQNARCFVECMMQRVELVDESGVFQVPHARQYIVRRVPALYSRPGASTRPTQETVDLAVDQCAVHSGKGRCMTNYQIWNCLYTKLHAQRIHP